MYAYRYSTHKSILIATRNKFSQLLPHVRIFTPFLFSIHCHHYVFLGTKSMVKVKYCRRSIVTSKDWEVVAVEGTGLAITTIHVLSSKIFRLITFWSEIIWLHGKVCVLTKWPIRPELIPGRLPFDQNFRNFRNGDKWYVNFQGKDIENSEIVEFPKNEPFNRKFRKFSEIMRIHIFFLFKASSLGHDHGEVNISCRDDVDEYSKMDQYFSLESCHLSVGTIITSRWCICLFYIEMYRDL